MISADIQAYKIACGPHCERLKNSRGKAASSSRPLPFSFTCKGQNFNVGLLAFYFSGKEEDWDRPVSTDGYSNQVRISMCAGFSLLLGPDTDRGFLL